MSIAEDLLTGLVASGVALRGEDGKNGLKGDQGELGPKGDKGDKGDPGQDGKDGTDGNDGKAGKDGKAGVKGDKGSDGVGPDEKVKVDRDDLRAGFLFDKIEAGRGISLRSRTARTGSRLVIDASPTFIGGGGAGPAGPAGPPGADGTGIPDGGIDGQVLTKQSATDGDADWETPGAGGSDDQTAAEVPFTPAGGIAATDVQAAIEEIDTEKAAAASAVMDGDAAGGDLSGTYPNPSVVNDSHSHGAGTAPGAGGLPAWWDVDSTPDAEIVTFEGRVDIAPAAAQALTNGLVTFRAPTGSNANDTDFVYIRDEFGNIVLLLTVNGGIRAVEGPDGSDGYSFIAASGDRFDFGTSPGGVMAFTLGANAGAVMSFASSPTTPTFVINADDEIGFFDKAVIDGSAAAPQQTIASLSDIYDALEAYGLVATASAQPTKQTYTESNVTTDRAFNANSTTVDELADVLGTLIADLRAQGLVA